nr:uncharacterized protein LOC127307947 [Lolium perenne]
MGAREAMSAAAVRRAAASRPWRVVARKWMVVRRLGVLSLRVASFLLVCTTAGASDFEVKGHTFMRRSSITPTSFRMLLVVVWLVFQEHVSPLCPCAYKKMHAIRFWSAT